MCHFCKFYFLLKVSTTVFNGVYRVFHCCNVLHMVVIEVMYLSLLLKNMNHVIVIVLNFLFYFLIIYNFEHCHLTYNCILFVACFKSVHS